MKSHIHIRNLAVNCLVGVYDWEQKATRPLFLDVDLDVDLEPAAMEDDVALTIDYAEVAKVLETHLADRSYRLIETICLQCIDSIFDRWPRVEKCRIRVKKPGAVLQARYVAVTMEKERSE